MVRDMASFFGNATLMHIILIEDGIELSKLPSLVSGNGQNVSRIYRVQHDKMMKQQHAVVYGKAGEETIIKLDRWERLSNKGVELFPAVCKGNLFITKRIHWKPQKYIPSPKTPRAL